MVDRESTPLIIHKPFFWSRKGTVRTVTHSTNTSHTVRGNEVTSLNT